VTSPQRLRAPEHVHWRRFDRELVVINLHEGKYFGLNEVAADAFEKLATGQTSADVVGQLLSLYAVERDTLQVDIETLIASLIGRGLLVGASVGAGAGEGVT
jgi:hypothetical protein